MSLKNTIAEYIANPEITALVFEAELEPISGPGFSVAPPTYARPSSDKSKEPYFAFSEKAFIPEKDPETGWYNRIKMDPETDSPRLGGQVKLDSVPSQGGRAEGPLWHHREELGVSLPGVVVSGASALSAKNSADQHAALDFEVSTWELAHRHVDAWTKFATQDGKIQIWQQPLVKLEEADPEKNLKTIISNASAEHASLLYRYFPNAAIYGFWLSSATAQRHKLPRAYSSEITGYGAHEIQTGTTKLDAVGGASNSDKLTVGKNSALKPDPKGKRPSEFGFGQVPSTPVTTGFQCELILQQASVSLPVLRSLRFDSKEQADAAQVVLTLLAVAGHSLSGRDGFLRSGCSLVTVKERWGWRRRGSRAPELIDVPTFAEISEALQEAVADAETVGLVFADPVTVQLSDAERQLILNRVNEEASKVSSGDD